MNIKVACKDVPICRVYGQKRLVLYAPVAYDIRITYRPAGDKPWVHGQMLIVPAGTVTDGASVPRFLHWWLPALHREYVQAALLHDYLYETHASERLAEHIGQHANRGRWLADRLFLAGLKGTKKWRNHLLYAAVRLFGGKGWRAATIPSEGAAS